ncbi:hypothetical protein AB0A05_27015 [Streptomyces sp. NPDC046374]|uniref:hypothetical protein n=1 Tax=Streptomyces sp. NPDC046374 TaxID=3154917 RepID=UPI00340E1FC8
MDEDKKVHQLLAALDALGYTARPAPLTENAPDKDVSYLAGSLLAVAETLLYELGYDAMPAVSAGFMDMMAALAGGDPEGTARGWAVAVQSRLNRTGIEMANIIDGEGKAFTNVSGPALLAAASVLNMVNMSQLDQRTVKESVAHVDHNLAKSRENLDQLRRDLKGLGFTA